MSGQPGQTETNIPAIEFSDRPIISRDHDPMEALGNLTPKGLFLNMAIDAANPALDSETRRKAKLLADAYLTTEAMLEVVGQKYIRPEQLGSLLDDPRVKEAENRILQESRSTPETKSDLPEVDFGRRAAQAVNKLYPPVQPTTASAA